MKTNNLLILGALALGAYFVFGKKISTEQAVSSVNPPSSPTYTGMHSSDVALMQATASEQKQGIDNAAIINATVAKETQTSKSGSYEPVINANAGTYFETGKTNTAGAPLIGYKVSGVTVIPNKTGKNYADLGAGTDASKW